MKRLTKWWYPQMQWWAANTHFSESPMTKRACEFVPGDILVVWAWDEEELAYNPVRVRSVYPKQFGRKIVIGFAGGRVVARRQQLLQTRRGKALRHG